MSYSFTVQDSTKAKATKSVKDELAKVVESQPVHKADRKVAQDAVEAVIGVLVDPSDDEVVSVSVSGSLGGRADEEYTSVNVSVSALIRKSA